MNHRSTRRSAAPCRALHSRNPARRAAALAAIGLTTAVVMGVAGSASAHVGVSSPDAAKGGFGKVVFRVPTESETASTTKVVITLPEDTPFAFVSAGAKPGWKVIIAKKKLGRTTKVGDYTLTEAARTVTWTTTGDGIAPSQFDEFAISAGPLPSTEDVEFTATQTYSDGEVVDWDQGQVGDKEPEHPAPVLALAAATTDHHGASTAEAASETASTSADGSGSGLATWLSGGALVVALAALVVVLRENRRRA